MSKIILTPNASGTGTFTIQSPATDTNRTFTLPDRAGELSVSITSASDPAADSNPDGGVGTVWTNTTSGKMYVLTDATEDANVWTAVGAGGTPVGSVIYCAANTPPTGFVKANGAALSRTTYDDLFAAIGTTFGSGDGSTTFDLPDLRGEFLRGWDDARGIDSGRSFGSAQADELKSHTHTIWQGGSLSQYGGTAHGATLYNTNQTTSATGGSETRPRNIALLACIKY